MRAVPIIAGGLILGGLWLVLRGAGPVTCRELEPGRYYYFIYTGPSKTFKSALGTCWPVIYTIDVYDSETDDYWPPADPVNEILESGAKCRVKVQESCILCGFELV